MPWTWQTSTLITFYAYVTTQNFIGTPDCSTRWIKAYQNLNAEGSKSMKISELGRGSECVVSQHHATLRSGVMGSGADIGNLGT